MGKILEKERLRKKLEIKKRDLILKCPKIGLKKIPIETGISSHL
jgi:hypothetical protein